jgi:hypothetical protein
MVEPPDGGSVDQELQRAIDLLRDAKITPHAGTRALSAYGILFVSDAAADAPVATLRAAGIRTSQSN